MPGTIQISVLEFKGFPVKSSPALLKVSLGKREYQTSDLNDFSFPLTTLRGDLIITLEDAGGNELAHLGIRTMSIVEKVSWDDIFPVDGGGGYLHLNLKFMLNQQEQTRIRAMREAALKEKQVFTANALSARFTNLIDSDSPSSSHASRTSSVQEAKNLDESVQAGSLSNPNRSVLHNIRELDFGREERSIPIEEIPDNDNDHKEKAGFDHNEEEAETSSTKKIDTRSSIHRIPLKSVSSEKIQEFPISSSSNSDTLNLKDDHQVSGGKTVNKVKIIANAFESGLDKVYVMPRGKKFLKVGDPKVDDVESQATVRSDQSKSVVSDPRVDDTFPEEEKEISTANSNSNRPTASEMGSNSGTEQSHPSVVVIDPTVDDMYTDETQILARYSGSDRSLTSETNHYSVVSSIEEEKDIEESEETEEFIPESPSNDPWNGLVTQAVKIALIFGFGVLVFLTRQRQPRKTLKKEEEGIKMLKAIEYINDDVFEAEKWIES